MPDLTNAVAFFLANKPFNEETQSQRQKVLRAAAEKYHMNIAAFMAIPKNSLLKHLQHTFTPLTKARALLIDEITTLFLPPTDLSLFLQVLSAHDISLVIADMDTIFAPKQLHTLALFLRISEEAKSAERGKIIKKSLARKKREGIVLGAKPYGKGSQEQAIVTQIVELHNAGNSLQKICDLLSANDIKSVHFKKWYPTTIKRIIERSIKLGAPYKNLNQ